MNDLGSITKSKLIKALDILPDDTELTFEFMIGSFYSNALVGMDALLKEAHMQGYKQAKEEDGQL